MSLLVIGDQWTSVVGSYWGAQSGLNVVHWEVIATAGTSCTDVQMCAELDTTLVTPYKALMHVGAQYFGTKFFRKAPRPDDAPVIHSSFAGPGTGGADAMPSGICGMIEWITGVFGKSGLGRIFAPFPSTAFMTAGEPNAGYATALGTLATAYGGPFTGGAGGNTATIIPIITKKSVLAVGYPITGFALSGVWHNLRSRSDQGKENPVPPFGV